MTGDEAYPTPVGSPSLAGRWRQLPPQRRRLLAIAGSAAGCLGLLGVVLLLAAAALWMRSGRDQPSSYSDGEGEVLAETVARQPLAASGLELAARIDRFTQDRQSLAPGGWLLYPAPVLTRGMLGDWDDFKVGSPVVLYEEKTARSRRGRRETPRYRMWYRGCHFVAHEYTCAIGHATSPDGLRWEKSPQPVHAPPSPAPSDRLDSVAMVRSTDGYLMWYGIGADPVGGRSRGTIHLASSADGLSWVDHGVILRTESQSMVRLHLSALDDGARLHLWYSDRPPGESRGLRHLISADGRSWRLAGATADEALGFTPDRLVVFARPAGGLVALTAAERYGRGAATLLTSPDGSTWQLAAGDAVELESSIPGGPVAHSLAALPADGGFHLWPTLRGDDGSEAIGYGFHAGGG